jgi:hypothetical protein
VRHNNRQNTQTAHVQGSHSLNKAANMRPLSSRTATAAAAAAARSACAQLKRSYSRWGSDDRLISIRLEGCGAAPTASKPLLQTVSQCAAGLPDDAAEWDLSGLLIEGQPVSHGVVVAWLHAAMMCVHEEPFAGEAQQEPPLNCSAAGLAQLLAFADAVGSSRGLLHACLPPLAQLQFWLRVGEQQEEVQLDVGAAYSWHGDDKLQLWWRCGTAGRAVHTASSTAAKAQLSQQFARQLEALLYLAHRLELDSLAQALHSCVRNNAAWPQSLLRVHDGIVAPRVLSARLLEEAAGPGQHSQLAFISSIVTQPVSFAPGPDRRQLFEPIDLNAAQKQPLKFKARLLEDFTGAGSKGQVVDVQLDLFEEGGRAAEEGGRAAGPV